MGTPAYMAPEQFCGAQTDARSDQFSFCVALWEALYGQRPFSGSTLPELSVTVTAGELVAAPKSEIPSWLLEVLTRGLAVEPERRHPSMAALLRALEDDPTRRRRMWAVAAGIAAILLAALAGLRLLDDRARTNALVACEARGRAITDIWNPSRKAELQAIFEASGSRVASSSWAQVEQRMDAYAQDWMQLHTEVCRATLVEHVRDEASYNATTACLDEHRAIFAALTEAWQGADAQIVGHAPLAVANLPPISACSGAAWLADRIEPPPDQQGRGQLLRLRARLQRVIALRLSGNFRPAADEAARVLDEAEQLGWAPLIAEARVELGEVRGELGEYDDARVLVEQAFVDALACGHDRVALEAASSATALTGYFLVDFDRGLYWARIAASLIDRMGLAATTREAALLTAVGHVRWARGDHEAALDSYASALRIHEATLGLEHPRVADALGNVGYMYKERGDYQRAADYYQRAFEINQLALGPEHPNVAISLLYIGEVLTKRGAFEQALEIYGQGLAIYEQAYGPEHPAVASACNELGSALAQAGRHDDAIGYFRRAITINRAAFGDEHPAVASVLNNLAAARTELANYEAALEAGREALRINEAAFALDHPRVAMSLNILARIHQGLGAHQQALDAGTRALAIFEAIAGGGDPVDLAVSLVRIGHAQLGLGRPTEARAAFERALALREQFAEGRHVGVSFARELETVEAWSEEWSRALIEQR
jgi:tetratricopeptide (TPR) repeat protein